MPRGYVELTDEPRFTPGFRCSKLDVAVLFIGYLITGDLAALALPALGTGNYALAVVVMGMALPIIAFFLFCNVFRVGRSLELVWAAFYVVMMVATIRYQLVDGRLSVTLSIGALFAVIYAEMRKPSYHGVGWQKINPDLPTWWKTNVAVEHDSPGRGGSA